MRRTLIAGNWKMNGSRASVSALLDAVKLGMDQVKAAQVAVCVPHIFIADVQAQLQGSQITWGGQDISVHDSGAYTGETAGSMLLNYGCQFVIIGHSERRTYHAETNQLVAEKFAAAHKASLRPICCIGETLQEREQGITEQVIAQQIDAVIAHCGIRMLAEGVLAYEPVWAIGTGVTATPEQAQAVHAFIRARIAQQDAEIAEHLRILYGGSMNAQNAVSLLAQGDIDGGLIGGASLKPADFIAICVAVNK